MTEQQELPFGPKATKADIDGMIEIAELVAVVRTARSRSFEIITAMMDRHALSSPDKLVTEDIIGPTLIDMLEEIRVAPGTTMDVEDPGPVRADDLEEG